MSQNEIVTFQPGMKLLIVEGDKIIDGHLYVDNIDRGCVYCHQMECGCFAQMTDNVEQWLDNLRE